jgi:hypothetical protein
LIDINVAPTEEDVFKAVENDDPFLFYSEDPVCIFHRQVTQIRRLSSGNFNVNLRIYDAENSLSSLLSESRITVLRWDFEFDVSFNKSIQSWETDNWADHKELDPVDIQTLPNSETLMHQLGAIILDKFDPEDILEIDIDSISSEMRPLFSNWLDENKPSS